MNPHGYIPELEITLQPEQSLPCWTGLVCLFMYVAGEQLVMWHINDDDMVPTRNNVFFKLKCCDKGVLHLYGDQIKVCFADVNGQSDFFNGVIERTVTLNILLSHAEKKKNGRYSRKGDIGSWRHLLLKVRAVPGPDLNGDETTDSVVSPLSVPAQIPLYVSPITDYLLRREFGDTDGEESESQLEV